MWETPLPCGLAPPLRRSSLRMDPGAPLPSPPALPRGHTLTAPREDPVHSSPHPLMPRAVTAPILWACRRVQQYAAAIRELWTAYMPCDAHTWCWVRHVSRSALRLQAEGKEAGWWELG